MMNDVGAFRWPWMKPRPSDDAGEDDLFNTPPSSDAPPVDDTIPVEEPTDTTSDEVDAFESAEPLPAHETTDETDAEAPADESTETPAVPDDSASPIPPGTEVTPDAGQPDAGQPDDGQPDDGQPVDGQPDGASSSDETEIATNSFFDGLITPGVDIRLQLVKVGRPPADTTRRLIPMQTQVNLAVAPVDWITVYGGFNASLAAHYSFAGQSSWEATVQLHPGVTLPVLRVGYMQPSIGIRHDDHTIFTRRDVASASGKPLIPPGYAELGAEISYEGLSWLTVNAGVFGSKNLADVDLSLGPIESLADFSQPSVLGRVMLWPQDLDLGINGELGASYFANGNFQMINVFAGLGMQGKGSFLVEGMLTDYPDGRHVRNVSVMGSYELLNWLSLDWRYEWGQTEDITDNTNELSHAHQAVFGAEVFVAPNVELRPEYRFFQKEPFQQIGGYLQGQYTIQLHVFY